MIFLVYLISFLNFFWRFLYDIKFQYGVVTHDNLLAERIHDYHFFMHFKLGNYFYGSCTSIMDQD